MTNNQPAPTPLLSPGNPVDWWFIFKFNSAEEPGQSKPDSMTGIFDVPGWKRPAYEDSGKKYSQQYLIASSADPTLKMSRSILGTTRTDPLGATFGQVYDGDFYYVLWNDQFYNDPLPRRGAPWGHSKGMVAWNDDGEGFVMQVSTPSWPASGSRKYPRKTDGNTLGFVSDDDIEVSQHFFALKLNSDDLHKVLSAMEHASVVTSIPRQYNNTPSQLINNGGPASIQTLVRALGRRYTGTTCFNETLSSGVRLLSKPSAMAVAPWQLVSAQLGGVDLRVASWWAYPKIYSTKRSKTPPECWSSSLSVPGAVDIATTGVWTDPQTDKTIPLGLTGGSGARYNHAKFGVSTSAGTTLCIFGDMNQQGALACGDAYKTQRCTSSQNGRGGMFFVLDHPQLFKSLSALLAGESAPTRKPSK